MFRYDYSQIKLWSNIGSRATFGLACLEIAKKNNKLMVLTADVSTSAGLDRFKKKFPDNYIDVGIAEQNMLGIAAGASSEKFDVVTTTFSPFQVLRCCEQIKMNLGYMKLKVIFVGLASGLILGQLGYSHCSVEDIGVLRSIPNITIISPADGMEIIKSLEAAIRCKESVYIRLTGGSNLPIIYKEDYSFKIGKAVEIIKGEEILIISNGVILKTAIEIAEQLRNKKMNISVVNMHTVKPLDTEFLRIASKQFKYIYTLEEHNKIGGLGSAVAESLIENKFNGTFKNLGINDTYTKSGSREYLLKINKLDIENISKLIINNYE